MGDPQHIVINEEDHKIEVAGDSVPDANYYTTH